MFSPSLSGLPLIALFSLLSTSTQAQDIRDTANSSGQNNDEAWWTGPLLAPSAATLAPGTAVIEVYAFESNVQSHFDNAGSVRSAPRSATNGSIAECFLGVGNGFTAGLFLRWATKRLVGEMRDRISGPGDTTLQIEYELRAEKSQGSSPTISLVLAETIPTGRFDNLGQAADEGLGAGLYTSRIALYSQSFFG